MEYEYVLVHHGVKGQRWGVRRYQKKDGSLTFLGRRRLAKFEKQQEAKRKAAQKEADDKAKAEAEREEKRAKLLKSTNAQELYENRDLLTTNEINERLTRIDAETRMAKVKEAKRFEKIDKALNFGRKLNEVYEFTNTPMMKAAKKYVFGIQDTPVNKVVDKAVDITKAYAQRDKMSDSDLQKALKRANTEKAMKEFIDKQKAAEEAAKTEKAAEKEGQRAERAKKAAEAAKTAEDWVKSKTGVKGEKWTKAEVDDRGPSDPIDADFRDVTDTMGDVPVRHLLREYND